MVVRVVLSRDWLSMAGDVDPMVGSKLAVLKSKFLVYASASACACAITTCERNCAETMTIWEIQSGPSQR